MLASRISFLTFLASSTLSASALTGLSLESAWFPTLAVVTDETSAPCTSVAETAPFPRNIKPAAIATDAAPKLYLRIP